jgi:hypothetical protein
LHIIQTNWGQIFFKFWWDIPRNFRCVLVETIREKEKKCFKLFYF